MSNTSWHYVQNGQQYGPIPLEQLKGMVAAGQLRPGDLVWTDGMQDWLPAFQVAELAPPAVMQPQPLGQVPGLGYAAPQYASPGYGTPGSLNYQTPAYYLGTVQYAGFWLRFVAWIIDTIILVAINFAIGFILGLVLGLVMGQSGATLQDIQNAATVVGYIVGIIVSWLYFALQESGSKQATPGKRALNLRVTDMQGSRITFGHATGRYFGKYLSGLILLIGYLMAGWTERKQALHDLMAGTLVSKG